MSTIELWLFAKVGNSKKENQEQKRTMEGQFEVINENKGMQTKEILLFFFL